MISSHSIRHYCYGRPRLGYGRLRLSSSSSTCIMPTTSSATVLTARAFLSTQFFGGKKKAELVPAETAVSTVGSSSSSEAEHSLALSTKTPVNIRKAQLTNHKRNLAHVQQKPLFPGTYKFVTKFEGEHVYDYGKHTWCLLREGVALWIIPVGCVIAFTISLYPSVPPMSVEAISLYVMALALATRVVAAGYKNKVVKDLTGRHVVITGGTSGIGLATAAQLARMGAHVRILSPPLSEPHANVHSSNDNKNSIKGRSKAQAAATKQVDKALRYIEKNCKHAACVTKLAPRHNHAALDGGESTSRKNSSNNSPEEKAAAAAADGILNTQQIEYYPLDLSDFIAVREYCKLSRERDERIDILVNNAGVLHQHQTQTRFGDDVQLATNYLGPYLLTEGLLPLVTKAQGRIVHTSCSAHVGVKGDVVRTYLSGRGVWSPRVANKFDGLEQYGFTKLGNIFYAQDLAVRSYPLVDPLREKKRNSNSLLNKKPLKANNITSNKNSSSSSSNLQTRLTSAKTASSSLNMPDVSAEPRFTTCACNPGAALSNLCAGVALGYLFTYCYPLFYLFMRSSKEASQTVVNCCVRDELKNGGYYMNMKHQPEGLSQAACSVTEREQLMTWTRKKMQPYMKWD